MAIKEGTTCYVTVVPKDKSGVAQTPTSMTYSVHDERSGAELLADTALTPGTSVEITIPPALNTVRNRSYENEVRVVTVKATYGTSDGVYGVFKYQVDRVEHL